MRSGLKKHPRAAIPSLQTTWPLAPSEDPSEIAVTASGNCEWTAASQSSWIRIVGAGGRTGSGTVTAQVDPNVGVERLGILEVAGRGVAISQPAATPGTPPSAPPPCVYQASADQTSFGFGGGSTNVNITTTDGCSWSASSQSGWITFTSGSGGVGSGSLTVNVAPNLLVSGRTGTVIAAGKTLTIQQAGVLQGCMYSIAPTSASIGANGGLQAVTVTTSAGCSWTAQSNASWIAISSGGAGTGSGTVQLAADPNPGASARSGIVTIAGEAFSLQQSAGAASCNYGINPTHTSVAVVGGTASVQVTAAAGCTWTAVSHDSWIVVTNGAAGSGTGTVQLDVRLSLSVSSRSGTVTIAGETFTVTQAGLLFP